MPPFTDKSVALVMIVKDESHVIRDTLENLCSYINFSAYYISDTGSTDNTKEIIRDFFKGKHIPGEITDDPWKNFGHNRTKAFENAFEKSDYVFVWDADDRISGSFQLPEKLAADEYRFSFDSGTTAYSRAQLFNNKKHWCYVGVLHEYPKCNDPRGESVLVEGAYKFHSNRTGARNKDPLKYQKDALILEEAYKEAVESKDPILNRYAFYCAQSYRDAGNKEKALEYYSIVAGLETSWGQERYVACIEAANLLEALGRAEEGLKFCVQSIQYDSERVEGIFRLVKWYCIQKQYIVAYKYYTWIQSWFENKSSSTNLSSKLFAKSIEYDFFLPYYMLIVCDKVGTPEARATGAKMIQVVLAKKPTIDSWWLQNFFHNIQFYAEAVYRLGGVEMCQEILEFWDSCRRAGKVTAVGGGLKAFVAVAAAKCASETPLAYPSKSTKSQVVFTVTTCKRLDLFRKTVKSILNTWTDFVLIDRWICVDDNSSEEDRLAMRSEFPWFEFILKSESEKGHCKSMQMLWDRVQELDAKVWIHMEDDWAFFRRGNYVERSIRALHRYKDDKIGQFVFNRNYGVVWDDTDRVGGEVLEDGLLVHQQRSDLKGKNCGYWPHFSLQPSAINVDVARQVGTFQPAAHFEKAYGERWTAAGWRTGFFDGLWSVHIGKQHWEKEGANAYSLNGISQFGASMNGPPVVRKGWVFRAGEDQIGEDLDRVTEGSVEKMLEEAEKDPRIVAVNSLGYRKLAVKEPLSRPGCFSGGGGLYVKVPVEDEPEPVSEVLEGDMRQHFASVTSWITQKKPFALIRPNDGEYLVLTNQTLTNADSWTFTSGGTLRTDLAEACSVASATKGIYVGIPCGSCKGDYSCKPEMFQMFDTALKIPRERQTYANLFMNCNWRSWLEFLKTQEFWLAAPGKPTGWMESQCKGHLPVSHTLVNSWDSDGVVETQKFLEFVKPLKGKLILVSAGPIAKIWITKAWQQNPTNLYVDCGATLDFDTKGSLRRQYATPGHASQNFCCSFNRIQPQPSKKYLVFFGTFLNEKYIQLLNLALQSLTTFSDLSEIQVCVLTSPELVGKVQEVCRNANLSVQIECRPVKTVFEAACARFDWDTILGVNNYEKILYLDTDMLVMKDLKEVFNSVDPGQGIAAVEEGEMGMPNMGGDLFRTTEGSWDLKMPGLNSGILLFRPTPEIREVFQLAKQAAQASASNPPACMDQPFLSWATITKDRFTRTAFKGIAGLFEKGWPDEFEELTLCHFSFPIGNADHKLKRMKEFLNFMLINELEGGSDDEWEGSEWGWRVEVCRIVFHKGRQLSTPWGAGTWKPVGPGVVQATWKGYTHFCKRMGSTMRCLRVGDFDRADALLLKDVQPKPIVSEDSLSLFFQGGSVQWQKLVV